MVAGELLLDENHTYWLGGKPVPSVSKILQEAGLIDDTYFTEDHRERGTNVHKAISHFLTTNTMPDFLAPDEEGYFKAAFRFLKQCLFEVKHVEHMVYSPTYNFAGTADAVGLLNGKWAVLDFKTGTPGRIHGLQLAGYAMALNDGLAVANTRAWVAYQRIGVYLNARAKYKIVNYNSSDDLGVFLACLTVTRWKGGM